MSSNPVKTKSWNDLSDHADKIRLRHLNDFFAEDNSRTKNMTVQMDHLTFDYSKQRMTQETIALLCALAQEQGLKEKRQAMMTGAPINSTENRAVLHTALRSPANQSIKPEIHDVLMRMKEFSDAVRTGTYRGATGKPVKTIVSIGIGGSDLGPRLICEALAFQKDAALFPVHFVSNMDAVDLQSVLQHCDPETTLFLMISKSFGTQETLKNAQSARHWLQEKLGAKVDITPHFIGISANEEKVVAFGIDRKNFFPLWDWVNGRFSLWSAVGLQIAICFGFEVFEDLLRGAYTMDQHFVSAPLDKNIPVLMGLIGLWNINFLGATAHAVLPYAQSLARLPAYLQQLEMESNGKSVDLEGQPITDYRTGVVLFGDAGTNGQHSFYQLLHQGTDVIAADLIGFIEPFSDAAHHSLLLHHMLAQGQALMMGRSHDHPHQRFAGNRPSTTMLFERLTPYTLGMLIAAYEHKTFVQGVLWHINSFDQFGVELGKDMAQKLDHGRIEQADSSTRFLYSLIHKS